MTINLQSVGPLGPKKKIAPQAVPSSAESQVVEGLGDVELRRRPAELEVTAVFHAGITLFLVSPVSQGHEKHGKTMEKTNFVSDDFTEMEWILREQSRANTTLAFDKPKREDYEQEWITLPIPVEAFINTCIYYILYIYLYTMYVYIYMRCGHDAGMKPGPSKPVLKTYLKHAGTKMKTYIITSFCFSISKVPKCISHERLQAFSATDPKSVKAHQRCTPPSSS